MNQHNSVKDKIEIFFIKLKLKVQKFLKTKFGAYLWQFTSSALILAVAGCIGIFAAYAKTEGSAKTYAKEYFKYFMTHSWSLMYRATDLEDSEYINEETFAVIMENIVPEHGSDKYKFVDRGSDGKYQLIDVVYRETGSKDMQTMTLRMKKKDEKRLFILNQWEVCMSDEMIHNCTVTVPEYVSVNFDGVDLAKAPVKFNEGAGEKTYTIDKTIGGMHSVKLSTYGTIEVTEKFAWENSKSDYRIKSVEFPLSNETYDQCSNQAIDIIIGMYNGVLTNGGCEAVKEFFTREDTKAAVDTVFMQLMSQVNRTDGGTLLTMSFDSYNTEVFDYVPATSMAVKFTFDTTFSARDRREGMGGVREVYQATAKGEAAVHFVCNNGVWEPYTIDMNCFDFAKPAEQPAA